MINEHKKGVKAMKYATKPRNFVAKNMTSSGAGAHIDKKKADKQGEVKHKKKEVAETTEHKLALMLELSLMKERIDELKQSTKDSYKEKATKQVKELEPHAKDGEYKDLAQRAIDRRNKGLERVKESVLNEEEYDYYRDYKKGLISKDDYEKLVRQFQSKSDNSYYDDQPVMTGMYFYDVKPDQEEDAEWIGVKKTKSGKWALIQYDSSGRTFNWKKQRADQKFGPGKFWSPKKDKMSEGGNAQPAAIAIAKRESGKYTKDGKRKKNEGWTHDTLAAELFETPSYENHLREMLEGQIEFMEGGTEDEVTMFSKSPGSHQHQNDAGKQIPDSKMKSAQPGKTGSKDEYDQEGEYLKNQLHTIKRVVTHLEHAIDDDENLPEWVQDKISQAKGMIVSVMDYMISEKEMAMNKKTGHDDDIMA